MNDFKIIAIRPLKGCDAIYIKNLSPGDIFTFYNDYQFGLEESDDKHSDVASITYRATVPEDLYDMPSGNKEQRINVSAIVGKNGSGKSTLFELLYLAIYYAATKEGILRPNVESLTDDIHRFEQPTTDANNITDRQELRDEAEARLRQLNYIYKHLKVEIYYVLDEDFYCLQINDTNSGRGAQVVRYIRKVDKKTGIISFLKGGNVKFEFEQFFYTIAINYSIYGLNSKLTGDWVDALFHKNDSYQTPIVINPFREEGLININNEYHLASSRLIVNLISSSYQVREILKGKVAHQIRFSFENNDNQTILGAFRRTEAINRLVNKEGKSKEELFEQVYYTILQLNKANEPIQKDNIRYYDQIADYTLGKIIKIAHQYREYRSFIATDNRRAETGTQASGFPSVHDLTAYLNKLADDKSHVTLKLRQILNTVRFDLLKEDADVKWDDNAIVLPIDTLRARIAEHVPEGSDRLPFVPAAFFKPQVLVGKQKDSDHLSKLEHMSSGELQLVHTLQSIYYHLIFVNSVHDANASNLHTYQRINLLFDEIELYFHPEFQQHFVQELLNGISHLKLDHICSINILFATHSPFILSDIPVANTLRIVDGSPLYEELPEETFGSNIHLLLANDFFMKDGFVGRLAKQKIESLIQEVNSLENEMLDLDAAEKLMGKINIIGEKFIRVKLLEKLSEKIDVRQQLEVDIREKEKELAKLKNRLNRRK